MGSRLVLVQRAVRGILSGGGQAPLGRVDIPRQVNKAVSALEVPSFLPGQRMRLTSPVRLVSRTIRGGRENGAAQGPNGTFAVSEALQPQRNALRADGEPAAVPGRSGRRSSAPDAPRSSIIYRAPERRESALPAASGGESSGEEGLRAQTVQPARPAAVSGAYAYPDGAAKPANSPMDTPLTREQENRITERVLEDLNYNRMAAEVLERVERRLRAERRKFGR